MSRVAMTRGLALCVPVWARAADSPQCVVSRIDGGAELQLPDQVNGPLRASQLLENKACETDHPKAYHELNQSGKEIRMRASRQNHF